MCVYGLESGEGGSVLMGLMCCLLHLLYMILVCSMTHNGAFKV